MSNERSKPRHPSRIFGFPGSLRLGVVREADVDGGRSQLMHDLFWRKTAALEAAGIGSTEPQSDCGHADDA